MALDTATPTSKRPNLLREGPAQEPERPALAPVSRSRSERQRLGKRLLLGAFVLAIAAAIAVAMRPKPIVVESALATRSSMRVTVDEDGVARIEDRYVVSAPIAGWLKRIDLNPGDEVKRGASMAQLMPIASPMLDERTRSETQARLAMTLATQRQTRAQLERARASHEFATDDAARKRALESSGAVSHELVDQAELAERTSASELESLRFALQVADHEVEMARAALGRMQGSKSNEQFEIQAPVNGKILRVIQSSEAVVQPGAPLLEIGDPNALEIAIDVLTSDAVRIHTGALVVFERWGGAALEGRVRRVDPSAFTRISALGVEEQRVNVIIDLTSPRAAWATLSDGYRVEAHIVVWDAADVLQIPGSAVFRHDSGWATFRVVAERAVLTPLEIGERTPSSVEVKRGLRAGDRVVLHPSDRVGDGVRVSVP
jgi:HlyD family secretion protein